MQETKFERVFREGAEWRTQRRLFEKKTADWFQECVNKMPKEMLSDPGYYSIALPTRIRASIYNHFYRLSFPDIDFDGFCDTGILEQENAGKKVEIQGFVLSPGYETAFVAFHKHCDGDEQSLFRIDLSDKQVFEFLYLRSY